MITDLSFTAPQRSPLQKKMGALLWIAAITTAAIGVFWLPWHCDSSVPVPGESYAFGFNNKVGILALGMAIFFGIAASYGGGRRTEGYQWLTKSPRFFPTWSEAKVEYRILIAACLLWSTWILFWGGYLVDPAWCESRGFYYGMDLLASGRVPYRDFMFNYGPATLYLPYWLSSLSGLSFEQAYPVILALFTNGGFVALFMILGRLELSKARRIVVLILLLIGWVAFSMGLQYAPLRFVIVPATLILLDAVVSRQDGSIFWSFGKAGTSSLIAVLGCFAISPEMGIAGGVAVSAYGFILLLRRSLAIWLGIACSLGALVAAAVVLRSFPDYLLSVFAFASGGGNFPIYPNLHNLTLVALSLFIIPALIAPALSNPSERRAPLAVALGVAGGTLLPAAFGRSDPGHVYYNGLTPIIIMFPATAALGVAWFRRWALCYVVMFVIALQFSYWSHYYGNYMNAIRMHEFYRQNPEMVNAWRAQWDQLKVTSPNGQKLHWSKVQPFPEELLRFSKQGPMLLTSGNEGNYWLPRFLILQEILPPDYFHAYSQGASTPAQIEQKIRESSAYEFLITPESAYGPLVGPINLDAYSEGVGAFLTKLLLFPVTSKATHPPYFPDTEYSGRMMDRFDPVAKFNGYIILQKKKQSL